MPYQTRLKPHKASALTGLIRRRLFIMLALTLLALAAQYPVLAAQSGQAAAKSASQDWEFSKVGLKNVLYPSLMLNIAKLKLDMQEPDRELGDPNGFFGISLTSPRSGAKAVVEISSSSPLINSGRAEVPLPKKGKEYVIYPYLSFSNELNQVRQPQSALLTAKLTLDGVAQGERQARVTIASVNDCVHSFEDDGDYFDTDWLYAAYVNENHPVVQQILREALATGEVSSFNGYQAGPNGVRKQLKAVWQALRRRGIRYSNISRPSAKPKDVGVQHVRLISEALAGRQANCVEGSCLLASIFYKIGLDTALVSLPEHMLVMVELDPKNKKPLYLETTMLDSSFEDAADSGDEQMEEAFRQARKAAAKKKRAQDDDDDDDEEPGFIYISEARKAGILAIPER